MTVPTSAPTPQPASDASALRLLWITEHYPPARGGMATSCDRIVRSLRAAGASVDVVHARNLVDADGAAPLRSERELGGSRLQLAAGDDPEHGAAVLLAHLTALPAAPDWTHVVAFGGVWSLCVAPVVAATVGAPLVTLLRGNDLDTGIVSPRRRAILDDAIRRAASVGCVSQAGAELVRRFWPGAQTAWTPNSLDLGDWTATPSDTAAAAALVADRADTSVVVGLIGHLKRKKGVAFLLEAFTAAGLTDRLHLLVVGDVDDAVRARLDGFATTRRGFCDRWELLRVLPACDLVALPSFYDGMPNVALEAAGLGIPLLASTAGGLADLCGGPDADNNACGWTFAPGDAAAARRSAHAAVSASASERHARGATARARVAAAFTPSRERDAYLRLFATASATHDAAAAVHSAPPPPPAIAEEYVP